MRAIAKASTVKPMERKPVVERKPVITNASDLVVEEAEDLVAVKAEVGRWVQYLADLEDEVQALGRGAAIDAVLQRVESFQELLPVFLQELTALEKRMDDLEK